MMSVRKLKRGMFSTCLGILFAFGMVGAVAKPANILFIMVDDMGWGDLGSFFQNQRAADGDRSEPWHRTPHLDTFADEGMQLRQHYCPAPVCAPSRASFLLGVHQGHANVRDNQFDKALEDNHTVANVLQRAGYTTALIGKYGLQGSGNSPATWPAYPTKRGFDYFYGYVRHGDGHSHYPFHTTYTPGTSSQVRGPKEVWDNNVMVRNQLAYCYTADLFTARAKQWLIDHQASEPEKPFFLFLAYDTPHAALQVPTMAYPAGGGINGGLQWIGTPGHMINTAVGPIDTWIHPAYTNATWDHDRNPATPEVTWPEVDKRFATMMRRIDNCVHDVKLTLQDLGIDEDTFVVFTSDNGPHKEDYFSSALANYNPDFFNGFGPYDGIKRDTWEGGIRVPTLVRWPGHIPSAGINQTPSQFHDWLATFADLAGVPAPARADGVSLLPTLTGEGTQRPSLTYVEYYQGGTTPSYSDFHPTHRGRRRNQMQVIFHEGYKGVRYDVRSQAQNFEIYDVNADPQEITNLAANPSFAALQQEMKDRVLRVRRPSSSASRPYDNVPVPAVTVAPVTTGVEWKAYERAFPWVPELTTETDVAAGMTNRPTVEVRTRDDDIGLLFAGFLRIPATGDYTFHLRADTGALLRIHEATVVDADYGYVGGSEVSGTIKLEAGLHPYRLYYARGTNGTPSLDLQWSEPSMPKAPIPDRAFMRAGVTPPGPPAANDDSAATTRDIPVLIDVLANDFDDGTPEPLRIDSVTQALAGATTIVSNKVLYVPRVNFLGMDTFTYTITDGADTDSARAMVDVRYYDAADIWFPFNQLSGLTACEAGGSPLGTLIGFSDATTPWVDGRFNRGIRFDGVDDHILVGGGYFPPSGTSARTTAAWIKTRVAEWTHPSNQGSIVAWGPNTTSIKYHVRLENSGSFMGALRVEVGGGSIRGTKDLRDGRWHHVAATFANDGSPNVADVKLYVDGRLESISEVRPVSINTTKAPATIGLDAQNRYFPGVIDEVRIYRRALSPGEVFALYNATDQTSLAWHRRYLGNLPVSWVTDIDVDGLKRLAEYGFGGNPWIPDLDLGLVPSMNGDVPQASFNRRLAGTHDLNYIVQVSLGLPDWDASLATEVRANPLLDKPGFERVTYESSSPVLPDEAQLIRVELRQNGE